MSLASSSARRFENAASSRSSTASEAMPHCGTVSRCRDGLRVAAVADRPPPRADPAPYGAVLSLCPRRSAGGGPEGHRPEVAAAPGRGRGACQDVGWPSCRGGRPRSASGKGRKVPVKKTTAVAVAVGSENPNTLGDLRQ